MKRSTVFRRLIFCYIFVFLNVSCLSFPVSALGASSKDRKAARKQKQLEEMQKDFLWWPTDAKPAPVQDPERGGFWWMPDEPGTMRPWGNRGYIYVHKIIFDYKAQDTYDEPPLEVKKPEVRTVPAPALPVPELKPSLLVKRIIRNVKIYFDYNKADLRDDHIPILEDAFRALKRNPSADLLITGNCDARGSNEYNLRLGTKRADSVKQYLLNKGINEPRIHIISQGKLNAIAPITDLTGMQKDRNAQFMVAEVEEIMIPDPQNPKLGTATKVKEGEFLIEQQEKIETSIKVSTREYVVQKNDTLSKIAQREMGGAHRWRYLYELNKERIPNPDRLRAGQTIIIPVE